MTIHWELWIAVVAVALLLVWLKDQITERITERISHEAERLRVQLHSLRPIPQEPPYPGNEEIIEAIGKTRERIESIAEGLAAWEKRTR